MMISDWQLTRLQDDIACHGYLILIMCNLEHNNQLVYHNAQFARTLLRLLI